MDVGGGTIDMTFNRVGTGALVTLGTTDAGSGATFAVLGSIQPKGVE